MISKHLLNAWRFENIDVSVRGNIPDVSIVTYSVINNDVCIEGDGSSKHIRYDTEVTNVLNYRKGTIIIKNWYVTNYTIYPAIFFACKSNGVGSFPFYYFSLCLYYHPNNSNYDKKLNFQIGYKPSSSQWSVQFNLFSNVDMNDTNPKTTIITWNGTTTNVGAIYNYQGGQLVDITNYSISSRGLFDYVGNYNFKRNYIFSQSNENYISGNFVIGKLGEIQIYNECFNIDELKKLLVLGRPTI